MRRKGSSHSLNAEPRSLSDDELWPKARGKAARKLRCGGALLMRMGLVGSAARGKPDHAFRQPNIARKLSAHAVTCEHLPIYLAVQVLRTFMNFRLWAHSCPGTCRPKGTVRSWRKPTRHSKARRVSQMCPSARGHPLRRKRPVRAPWPWGELWGFQIIPRKCP